MNRAERRRRNREARRQACTYPYPYQSKNRCCICGGVTSTCHCTAQDSVNHYMRSHIEDKLLAGGPSIACSNDDAWRSSPSRAMPELRRGSAESSTTGTTLRTTMTRPLAHTGLPTGVIRWTAWPGEAQGHWSTPKPRRPAWPALSRRWTHPESKTCCRMARCPNSPNWTIWRWPRPPARPQQARNHRDPQSPI